MTDNLIWEILKIFAMFYGSLYSLFLAPYILFVNKIVSLSVLLIYIFILIVYIVGWIFEKKEFFKNEAKI